MKHPFRPSLLAALALSAAIAACGGDDSSSSPSDHPAGLLVSGDFDTASTTSESSDLMFALQQAGFPLDTTSGEDSVSIAALISGKDIVFLPETSPSFDAGTEAILENFVNNGGTIVLVGGYDHVDWVNATFGWTLDASGAWTDDSLMPRLPGASGTPFAGGPATITANNGGGSLLISSLPTGAKAVYGGTDTSSVASVAILPSGDGRLVYFGWDWYDGAPVGVQDNGWGSLLRKTAGF